MGEHEVAQTLAALDPVWETLTPREQTGIVERLIERVNYDGASGKVTITFQPAGIQKLADELAALLKEKTA